MARRVAPVFLFMILLLCGMRSTAQSSAPCCPHHHDTDPVGSVHGPAKTVEARAASGEFERTAAIAAQPAESISRTAQDFGQDDDITVLTLTRLTVGKQSTTEQTVNTLSPSVAQSAHQSVRQKNI
jgi:hypothetical protein